MLWEEELPHNRASMEGRQEAAAAAAAQGGFAAAAQGFKDAFNTVADKAEKLGRAAAHRMAVYKLMNDPEIVEIDESDESRMKETIYLVFTSPGTDIYSAGVYTTKEKAIDIFKWFLDLLVLGRDEEMIRFVTEIKGRYPIYQTRIEHLETATTTAAAAAAAAVGGIAGRSGGGSKSYKRKTHNRKSKRKTHKRRKSKTRRRRR